MNCPSRFFILFESTTCSFKEYLGLIIKNINIGFLFFCKENIVYKLGEDL